MRRYQSPAGAEAQRSRMASIEPVFGDLKWNMGESRMRRRGTRAVKADLLLRLLAKNLKRMLKAAQAAGWDAAYARLRHLEWLHARLRPLLIPCFPASQLPNPIA